MVEKQTATECLGEGGGRLRSLTIQQRGEHDQKIMNT